ncbi:S8 family serine peptidase [Actinoplanes siamensis]|uniref:Peptidase S8/S53 domain-containing protein n=1 Tax=Actinoplanes siamensis TaxID=1223317 RepID=A0A919N3F8_9ACTN|nr:S8 family serine peptidase [Actinoplanes siamensis]GIF03680.1 hypothetical protein Asi03nite_12180 [Actinoplanes siamensis]
MKVVLRRYAAGAVATAALAGVAAFALPAGTADWTPVTYGLTESADQLVPATVTPEKPARVVSTTIDKSGRPVVRVEEATDQAAAAELVKKAQRAENAVGVEIDAKVVALDAPSGTDLYRGHQWDLAKMRAIEAWHASTGAGVTVAVIDTGVDATNVDLAGKVLTGWDATTDQPGGDVDRHGHGTHVAGTIGAVTGNTIGVSAVAPDTRILPVRVLGDDGSGYMSDTAEGIVWAADHGAQVINMSLGATTQVGAVSNAVAYARDKGVTVVAAAGNERGAGSPVSYPAADAGVVAVAATDSSDQVASYSNAGGYVDVAAPGSGIVSTYPSALGRSYASMSGTSMAAPHVAALAALLEAAHPGLGPDRIEQAIETSAVDLGTPGKDEDYGYGRVDAVAALAAVASSAPTTAPSSQAPSPSAPSPSASTSPVAKAVPVVVPDVTAADVAYHGTTVTSFTVTAGGRPWAGRNAQLCVAETDASFQCLDVVTSATGVVSASRIAVAGYQLELRIAASEQNEAATGTAAYTVRSTVRAIRSGSRAMTVSIASPAGLDVEVQQLTGGVWTKAQQFTTGGTTTSITVHGLAAGERYRVVVPATATVAGATSGVVIG